MGGLKVVNRGPRWWSSACDSCSGMVRGRCLYCPWMFVSEWASKCYTTEHPKQYIGQLRSCNETGSDCTSSALPSSFKSSKPPFLLTLSHFSSYQHMAALPNDQDIIMYIHPQHLSLSSSESQSSALPSPSLLDPPIPLQFANTSPSRLGTLGLLLHPQVRRQLSCGRSRQQQICRCEFRRGSKGFQRSQKLCGNG